MGLDPSSIPVAAALAELTVAYRDRPGCWGCLRRDFPEHRKPLSAGEPLQEPSGTEKPQNVSNPDAMMLTDLSCLARCMLGKSRHRINNDLVRKYK